MRLGCFSFSSGGRELNTFFSQTFRAPPGYPGKIAGYPAKKFGFPGFRRTYRTFWPPLLHVEDPPCTPPEDIRTKKGGQKRHINIRHKHFHGHPVTGRSSWPGTWKSVYVTRVPHTAHKHSTPRHPGQIVYVYVPFPFLKKLGVPKPGCLQFLLGSARLRSYAPFCILLRSFADLHCALLRSFALICVFLRPAAFRTTAFGNCRKKFGFGFLLLFADPLPSASQSSHAIQVQATRVSSCLLDLARPWRTGCKGPSGSQEAAKAPLFNIKPAGIKHATRRA